MRFAALLALLFANSAFATGLDDLRGALAALQGQGTLRGTYEVRQQTTELDGKDNTPQSASAVAQVEEDDSGLQVRWDRALIKRANEQSWAAKGGKKGQALSTLIGSTSPLRVAGAVNYASPLLHALEGAQLKSERSDSWHGKGARLLELSLVEAAPAEEKVKMKESTHTAQIWLGADGAPMGATLVHKRKASVMVFLTFEQESREEFVFSVVANRLVLTKRDEQGTAKGLGSTSQYRNTYTFTPKG